MYVVFLFQLRVSFPPDLDLKRLIQVQDVSAESDSMLLLLIRRWNQNVEDENVDEMWH